LNYIWKRINRKSKEKRINTAEIRGVKTSKKVFYSDKVILATGGKGYPTLGSEGDGFELAKKLGHKITAIYPAMMPLYTKEKWVENCRADTLAKVEIKVNIKKYQKLKAKGDLIFTKEGIRGPVVLDFAREITPLLEKYDEVPILINLKNLNQDQISKHLKNEHLKNPTNSILEHLKTFLPHSISNEICKMLKKGYNRSLRKFNIIYFFKYLYRYLKCKYLNDFK